LFMPPTMMLTFWPLVSPACWGACPAVLAVFAQPVMAATSAAAIPAPAIHFFVDIVLLVEMVWLEEKS
jgi:hypothetical protein